MAELGRLFIPVARENTGDADGKGNTTTRAFGKGHGL